MFNNIEVSQAQFKHVDGGSIVLHIQGHDHDEGYVDLGIKFSRKLARRFVKDFARELRLTKPPRMQLVPRRNRPGVATYQEHEVHLVVQPPEINLLFKTMSVNILDTNGTNLPIEFPLDQIEPLYNAAIVALRKKA